MTSGSFFRWGLEHLDLVEDAGDLASGLSTAENNVDRWEAIKPFGDKLAPAIDDLVAPSALSAEDAKELEGKLIAALQSRPRGLSLAKGTKARDGKWLSGALEIVRLLLPILLARR